jgi:hypothetical protein
MNEVFIDHVHSEALSSRSNILGLRPESSREYRHDSEDFEPRARRLARIITSISPTQCLYDESKAPQRH